MARIMVSIKKRISIMIILRNIIRIEVRKKLNYYEH